MRQTVADAGLIAADTGADVVAPAVFRLGREIDGETYLEADVSWFRGIVSGVVRDQKSIDPVIRNIPIGRYI